MCTSLDQSIFHAHWCADYTKTHDFRAGGISKSSSPFCSQLRRQNFIPRAYNFVSYAGYVCGGRKFGPSKSFFQGHRLVYISASFWYSSGKYEKTRGIVSQVTPSSRSIVVALHKFYKGLYRKFSDRYLELFPSPPRKWYAEVPIL